MMERIRRVPKLVLAGAGLVVVAALVAAAVAAFAGGGSSTAATTGGPPDPAALQGFTQCLSDHGVQPPQPGQAPQQPGGAPQTGGVPGRGAPSQRMQQAFQACRQYLPQGGPTGPPGGLPMAPPGS
jgi:hypothetical protein